MLPISTSKVYRSEKYNIIYTCLYFFPDLRIYEAERILLVLSERILSTLGTFDVRHSTYDGIKPVKSSL